MAKRQSRSSSPPLRGRVTVPGDKSMSHRALLVSALVRAVGVPCRINESNREAEIDGRGWEGMSEPDDVIDAANSGTTARLGLGLCAGLDGVSVVTGDDTLRRRPMLRVVAPLRQMGASIDGR